MAGFHSPALCEETILRMSVVAVMVGTVISNAVSATASVSISSKWKHLNTFLMSVVNL